MEGGSTSARTGGGTKGGHWRGRRGAQAHAACASKWLGSRPQQRAQRQLLAMGRGSRGRNLRQAARGRQQRQRRGAAGAGRAAEAALRQAAGAAAGGQAAEAALRQASRRGSSRAPHRDDAQPLPGHDLSHQPPALQRLPRGRRRQEQACSSTGRSTHACLAHPRQLHTAPDRPA
jgi:hypothetical protein